MHSESNVQARSVFAWVLSSLQRHQYEHFADCITDVISILRQQQDKEVDIFTNWSVDQLCYWLRNLDCISDKQLIETAFRDDEVRLMIPISTLKLLKPFSISCSNAL